jgi:sulfide:quinone oxidoreductase
MLLHSHFRERGMEGRTRIHFYTVEKAPMATAGPEIGKHIVSELEKRSIDFHPSVKLSRVDESSRRLVFEDGTEAPCDLLIAVPPHEAPRAVRESGLTNQAGWVPVDPKTLALASGGEPHRVFAIGDVTTVPLPGRFQPEMPLSLPKAGVFAEGQARTVADQIAAHVLGREPGGTFDGKGFCYIETGAGRAMRGDGDFYNLPHPMMVPGSPDEAQYKAKKEWATGWMDTYL